MLHTRLIVAGSRAWPSVKIVFDALDFLLSETDPNLITIISGMCPNSSRYVLDSPDIMGVVYAQRHGLNWEEYPANWRPNGIYDNKAGFKRNVIMAEKATHLAAFWDGKSPGTNGMINQAKAHGLVVAIIDTKGYIKRL